MSMEEELIAVLPRLGIQYYHHGMEIGSRVPPSTFLQKDREVLKVLEASKGQNSL
jgi:hypothetical protein